MTFTTAMLESTIHYAHKRAQDTQVKRYVYAYRKPAGGWHYSVYSRPLGTIATCSCSWCGVDAGDRHLTVCETLRGSHG